jgi:hypothetical protein
LGSNLYVGVSVCVPKNKNANIVDVPTNKYGNIVLEQGQCENFALK